MKNSFNKLIFLSVLGACGAENAGSENSLLSGQERRDALGTPSNSTMHFTINDVDVQMYGALHLAVRGVTFYASFSAYGQHSGRTYELQGRYEFGSEEVPQRNPDGSMTIVVHTIGNLPGTGPYLQRPGAILRSWRPPGLQDRETRSIGYAGEVSMTIRVDPRGLMTFELRGLDAIETPTQYIRFTARPTVVRGAGRVVVGCSTGDRIEGTNVYPSLNDPTFENPLCRRLFTGW
jgi:hypothetical protein